MLCHNLLCHNLLDMQGRFSYNNYYKGKFLFVQLKNFTDLDDNAMKKAIAERVDISEIFIFTEKGVSFKDTPAGTAWKSE